jgi:Mrp family chromosome partitioning ATPase/polyhydroxyalkanoate synthesis regulator phasin
VVDAYVEHLAELRRPVEVARLAEREATRLAAELRGAEERARAYAEANGIVSIDSQKDLLLNRLSDAETRLATAERERLEAERNIVALRGEIDQLPPQIRTSTVTRRNPAADQLLDRIATLEARAARFVPGSSAAASLETEIAAVRAQLRNVAGEISEAETTAANQTLEDIRTRLVLQRADARALAVRVDTLRTQIADLEAELRRLEGHEIAYRERVRTVEAKQEALRYALRRQEETRISERLAQASLSRVVPVGPALTPLVPDRPRRKLILILGAAVGLAGGVGLAYALEFVRRTMTTREEVEATLGYPAVASFLQARRRRRREHQVNRIECRHLINLVADLRGRQGAVAVLVTSARSGEGRSYVSERLAEELRDEGASVLLVGVEQAGAPTAPTRPDVVVSSAEEHGEQLPAVSDESGRLAVVQLAGPPAETHARLNAMLDEPRHRRDVVVIDSLPVESCPEQLRILGRVDSVVFVVEADRTPVFAARRCVRAFEDAGVRTLGVVLNKRRFQIPGWVYHRLLRPA